MAAENAAILRYEAHAIGDAEDCEATFDGAEVLVFRGGKILTVSHYYCRPTEDSLIEVARLAENRHGESSYAMSGYGAMKHLQIKRQFDDVLSAGIH